MKSLGTHTLPITLTQALVFTLALSAVFYVLLQVAHDEPITQFVLLLLGVSLTVTVPLLVYTLRNRLQRRSS